MLQKIFGRDPQHLFKAAVVYFLFRLQFQPEKNPCVLKKCFRFKFPSFPKTCSKLFDIIYID